MAGADKLLKIHGEAIRRFDEIWTVLQDERSQCISDRRFYSIAGAQWEGDWANVFDQTPMMEINKLHGAVMDTIIEYRNNRISVNFRPNEKNDDSRFAEVLNGLYRASEIDSGAQEAYDNALEEGVGGGFGAWRLTHDYEDDEDDEDESQVIKVEPIFDADKSVFFDLNAKRQDKSDAAYVFVLRTMTPEAFEEEFPGSQAVSMPNAEGYTISFDWFTPDYVTVGEYYVKEKVKKLVYTYENDLTGEKHKVDADDLAEIDKLEVTGWTQTRRRKISKTRVHKYIMSGNEILEDCGYIAGKYLPIIPYYGKRWYIDGVERCMGVVRLAKDAARLYNMEVTKLAELAVTSPRKIPIWTPEQINGHETWWADANTSRYPYMTINALHQADGTKLPVGPVGYLEAPDVPAPMAALLDLTNRDMSDITGSHRGEDKIVSHVSAHAIELVQTQIDRKSFIFLDNFRKSMAHCGMVWLSMAKEIYVEKSRAVKTEVENGDISIKKLNHPMADEDGVSYIENDMTEADFDVYADVGPAFGTKKDKTVRSLIGMLQYVQDPETANTIVSTALMNMDGDGLRGIQKYMRRQLVARGVVDPTEEEMAQMQHEAQMAGESPPSPNDQYLQAAAMNEHAKAIKTRADTLQTAANVEKTQAETAKIWADMDVDEKDQVIKIYQALMSNNQLPQG